jgi:hypothetical protein
MIHQIQFASFAFKQFEYGLQGLTDEEARTRLTKADGSLTNSISWITSHVAWQWIRLAARAAIARGEGTPGQDPYPELRARARQFRNSSDDPTPPSLQAALDLLRDACEASKWLIDASDLLLSQAVWGREDDGPIRHRQETLGTSVIRGVLHSWYHTGEVNMIRQFLGHPEIPFIQFMAGNMEWIDEETVPAWVDFASLERPAQA